MVINNPKTSKGVSELKAHYKETVTGAIRERDLDDMVSKINTALSNSQNTIYLFGERSNHSVIKHAQLSLQDRDQNITRYDDGLRTHIIGEPRERHQDIFFNALKEGRAGAQDLAIIVEGQGGPESLSDALWYCEEEKVPTINLTNSEGDGQLSEDVNQILLRLAIERRYQSETYAESIALGIDLMDPNYLLRVSASIADAMKEGKAIDCLGFSGEGTSITAEHMAHDLRHGTQRIVTESRPPKIFSTLSSTNYLSVDRSLEHNYADIKYALASADEGDVALFYLIDGFQMKHFQDDILGTRVTPFVFSGTGHHHSFSFSGKGVVNDLASIANHMIMRITHTHLRNMPCGDQYGITLKGMYLPS